MNFIGNACLPQTSDCLEREQVFLGWGPVKSATIIGIHGFLLKMLNLMKFSKFHEDERDLVRLADFS